MKTNCSSYVRATAWGACSMWHTSTLYDWRNEFLPKNCGVKLRRTKYELSSMDKLSHSHPQFPRSLLGKPGFLHRCFPVFLNINLRTPGSFRMLFTRCGDEVSR